MDPLYDNIYFYAVPTSNWAARKMKLMLAQSRTPFITPLLPSRRSSLRPQRLCTPASFYSSVLSLHFSRGDFEQFRLCNCTKLESEGTWEEPGDGSGSDYEDVESEGYEDDEANCSPYEQDLIKGESEGYEDDEANCSPYEQDLIKEIAQLLTPEEKAILDSNKFPDLSKISTRKWHPLHSYALSIQIPLMDRMLESGVDINSVDKDGLTPLHKAVMGKKEAVISHLLRKQANPHVRDNDGATPLHYAVQVGAMQTVKLLIKYKVDVNVADNEGWTPLHLAIQGRNRDIAKVLLVNGADGTRRNKDGKFPLDLSLCYGREFKSYDLAKLLKLVPANR